MHELLAWAWLSVTHCVLRSSTTEPPRLGWPVQVDKLFLTVRYAEIALVKANGPWGSNVLRRGTDYLVWVHPYLHSWNRAKNSHQLAYFKAMQSHHLTNEPIIWKPATFYLWTRNVCTNCFYQFFDYKTRKQLRFKHSACSFKTLGIKAKVCPYVFVVFQSSSNRPWHQFWNISGVIFW